MEKRNYQEARFMVGYEGKVEQETRRETKGAFLVKEDRVFNGQLGRSRSSFVRTAHYAHSAHSLRSNLLR